ncbi:acyl-CoA carboxylase subunit epsilon [Sphaerisporangium perillae]|uniref:acyl-CoA carboxylase subunit epsilon n=1 Tax=Sphaerisporangium perillae TaxID=2935860 RepID=UPI00201002C1|nr:acyl-CoA carboxylase subunit epsilon [Sphaerisporangium perillae]
MTGAFVVRGEPTAEELAALVTVLALRAGTAGDPAPAPRNPHGWAARHHALRPPLNAGPGAWRGSMWKFGGLR